MTAGPTWQPIDTVPPRAIVTFWLESLDGNDTAMTGYAWSTDPVLIIRNEEGLYPPHENGCYATHWIARPRPSEQSSAAAL